MDPSIHFETLSQPLPSVEALAIAEATEPPHPTPTEPLIKTAPRDPVDMLVGLERLVLDAGNAVGWPGPS